MPIQNASVSSAQVNQSSPIKKDTKYGIVYDVILDENNKFYKSKNLNASHIGSAVIILSTNSNLNEDDMSVIMPYDKNFKSLPIKNEKVEIVTTSGAMYYKRNGSDYTPNVDSPNTTISTQYSSTSTAASVDKSDYSNVEQTGITNTNTDSKNDYDNYGKYFKYTDGIRKLKLYEGDTIIESRFGQSIRFSGYNNDSKEFSPTLLIRNHQHFNNSNIVEEDVNKDGSVIAITSNKYNLPFQPGSVGDNNTGNFQTKPLSFKSYPTQLNGDQILINSDRIIISSKSSEMIFYSKGNYGFISDGNLSIDNMGGITANLSDNVDITTNDKDVNLNTGNGKINLGSESLEPIVKGNSLVSLLERLVDTINNQIFLTPSGPTATGPENRVDFNQIKSELKDTLSKLNQTS